MSKSDIKMPLPKLDDLFTTEQERQDSSLEKVVDISLTDIQDFPNHPFKVIVNEEMQEMAQSISEYGVLLPVLVRPLPNGKYQMISGHRRKKASEIANKETMPCIVRNLTDDEATIIMVDSNLQREHILPSERAYAYKMKLEAMTHQGQRNDLTCSQVGNKLSGKKSLEILAEEVGESKSNVHRFIRLTELIKPLLDMVDNDSLNISPSIALSPAYEISFLTKQEQEWLLDSMECNVATPTVSQAQEMKDLSKNGKLDEDKIEEIMSREKPNQVEKLKLDFKDLKPKMPSGMPTTEWVKHIYKALDYYNRAMERQKQQGAR